jgi:hypothetical protein
MIPLASKTNVTAPGGAFPYGNIKDNTGINDGTPVDKAVYADFHQFFARLVALSSITPNGLPEDVVNGFQYMEAFLDMANSFREERFYGAGVNAMSDADVGCLVIKINAGAGGLILPPLTALNNYKKVMILNSDVGLLSIVPDGSDVLFPNTGTIDLEINESIMLEASFLNSTTSPCWNVVSIYKNNVITPITVSSFLNSWTATTTVKYRKNYNGMVTLQGVVGVATVSSGIMFNLPAGYRPSYDRYFNFLVQDAAAFVQTDCIIYTNGNVYINIGSLSGPAVNVRLDGISFYID